MGVEIAAIEKISDLSEEDLPDMERDPVYHLGH
jgi:hypothetical protein